MAPPPASDSAVSLCFSGYSALLQRHSPPWSPPSCPAGLSPSSQQQPSPWDCSPVPMLQLPAAVYFRILGSLTRVHTAAARIVWFSLHSDSHRSAASLSNSLKYFPCVSNDYFNLGIWPLLQFPSPQVQVQSCSFSSFPLPSFVLLSFGSIYSFPVVRDSCLLSGSVLRDSASEGVFLMYPWREMYCTSGYSVAILSSSAVTLLFYFLGFFWFFFCCELQLLCLTQ